MGVILGGRILEKSRVRVAEAQRRPICGEADSSSGPVSLSAQGLYEEEKRGMICKCWGPSFYRAKFFKRSISRQVEFLGLIFRIGLSYRFQWCIFLCIFLCGSRPKISREY